MSYTKTVNYVSTRNMDSLAFEVVFDIRQEGASRAVMMTMNDIIREV